MLINLKALRKEADISQQRLGEAVNISQQSINQYENQDVEPDIANLTKLADYFNTSIDYLVGRTDIRRKIEKTEAFDLNDREAEVIERYRTLSEKEKVCIDLMIQTLSEK